MRSGDSEVECPVCQTQILLDKVDMDSAVDRACAADLAAFSLQSQSSVF